MSEINSDFNACMFKQDCIAHGAELAIQKDKIRQLEQELEEAKKDQARYQWLAGQFKMVSPDMGGNHTYQLPYRANTLRGLCVDSIIDAAIKESSK